MHHRHAAPTPWSSPLSLPLYLLSTLLLVVQSTSAVWPHPTWIRTGSISRNLDPSTLRLTSNIPLPEDVHLAFDRTSKNIARYSLSKHSQTPHAIARGDPVDEIHVKLVPWKEVQDTKQRRDQEQWILPGGSTLTDAEQKKKKGIAAEAIQKLEALDEKYVLEVPEEGKIVLRAASSLGILRGFTTLEHLTYRNEGQGHFIPDTPIKIKDEPAWPYRGLLIDTARNFYPVDALKHQLDAMAFVKMNQFHWHIVDSHSFPLQLSGDLAKLSEMGAYSPREIYSRQEIADLVQYAGERGINVNVEIDMPGHTFAGVKDYDATLLTCANQLPWAAKGNEPPTGQLDIRSKKTHTYVKKLLSAVAGMFPGPYVSTGNDEVNLACYNMTQNSEIDGSLLKPFVQEAHRTLQRHGKTAMVWEEAAINFPDTGKSLLPGTIVEAWTTPDNVAAILSANDQVKLLHAPYTHFYLDCGRGSWTTNTTSASWCEYVPWSKMYSFDPTNGTTEANVERVVGGEAALWSEQSDAAIADSLIWPRSAAAAEVFWTGKYKTAWKTHGAKAGGYEEGQVVNETGEGGMSQRSLVEATPRLNELRDKFVARGIQAMPVQPRWCVNNPASCMAPW